LLAWIEYSHVSQMLRDMGHPCLFARGPYFPQQKLLWFEPIED
jgi:hypothetical protein